MICWSIYTRQSVVTELHRITPPVNKDELHHILYEEIETAVKMLKKHKSPGIDDIMFFVQMLFVVTIFLI